MVLNVNLFEIFVYLYYIILLKIKISHLKNYTRKKYIIKLDKLYNLFHIYLVYIIIITILLIYLTKYVFEI